MALYKRLRWESNKVAIEAGTRHIYLLSFRGDEPSDLTKIYMNAGVAQLAFSLLTFKRIFVLDTLRDSLDLKTWEDFEHCEREIAPREFVTTVGRFDPDAIAYKESFWRQVMKREADWDG